MEQVSSPLPFTKEAIHSLNNGSVNFEEARALFNVDLSTFKAMLKQLNIFVWKEVNGSIVTIHGGDYEITIVIKNIRKHYVMKTTDSFEDVIRMLEKQLKLSPGCYKLTYKSPNRSVGKVWIKTDRDWDLAVLLSKVRGYFVLLYLEVFASSQTADEDACFEGACDEDVSDDDFYVDDLDEDEYVENFYVEDAFNEDACDEVSGNLMEPIAKEAILSLNNGSVTFEEARALFNVDLSTFKARLEQLNIYVWKEVNGSLVRIHGGDYKITILLKDMGRVYSVKATDPFEYVIRMLEEQLKLSPGCYKLTYKHPNRSVGNVWVKTDRDWHSAVLLSKWRGYFVILYLEVFASSLSYDEDACDEDACDEPII
ncbi:hypothetical protein Tco_0938006 [Tanacetum coccineum]|uniref:PB1 domain-containing protein n=1 Tax=Tanacetum coccineum TaxID=301880 RepID=A0ABQ5DFW2_9ASTR